MTKRPLKSNWILIFLALNSVSCGTADSQELTSPLEGGATHGDSTTVGNLPLSDPRVGAVETVEKSWALFFSSKCNSTTLALCRGGYGFKVSRNGSFSVGPGPQGEVHSGNITNAESLALRAAVNRLSSYSHGENESETCENVIWKTTKGEKSILRRSNHNLCFSFDSEAKEAALAVHDELSKLVEKYYPNEFPNRCLDVASVLDQVYESYRACKTSRDCVYVDENYLPVRPESSESITTDDCTYLKPLVVANSYSIVTDQRRLILEREAAREVCGTSISRRTCEASTALNSARLPPVCIARRCHSGGVGR
jgi:hypothetical protein